MDRDMRTVKFHELTDTHAHGSYQDEAGNTIPATFTQQSCRNHSFHMLRLDMNYWMDANQSEQCQDYGSW
jgi:hypothetical protein